MKKIHKFLRNRNAMVVFAMVVGTLIYSFAVVWILDLGEFYAGGVTGVSQLISRLLERVDIRISKSIFIGLLNVPLFFIGWKGVSKRFAILSVASIIIQVVSIFFFEFLRDNVGLNFFEADLGNERLILAIFGGLVCGIGGGFVLRYGASTGGMDILSQFVSFKKNISFTKFALIVDIFIVIFGGIVGGSVKVAVYTLIRLIIYVLVLDRIHTIYNYMKLSIVTTKKEEMRQALIGRFNHGITIYEAVGGYTNQPKWVLETVVSSYETEDYKNTIREIDPQAFVTYTAVKSVVGLFNKNAIA